MPSLPKDGSCSESGFSLSRRAIYQSPRYKLLAPGREAGRGREEKRKREGKGGRGDGNVCACVLSCIRLFAIPWTVALQALLSLGFPRQEYWSGLTFPPPGDLPNPGIEPVSPTLARGFVTAEPSGKPQ